MAKPKWDNATRDAAIAHTDLNIFAAVAVLLESSLNSQATGKSAQRIIAICQKEQASCLERYDLAIAMVAARAA